MLAAIKTLLRPHISPSLLGLYRRVRYHPKPPPLQGPYIVVGLFRAASGIGESARLCYTALEQLGLKPCAFDLSEHFKQVELPFPPGYRFAHPWPEGGSLIIHLNALEMEGAIGYLGPEKIRNKRIVGVWAWELPRVPQSWVERIRYVDEIWACSRFVARALPKISGVPVKVVHHPVQEHVNITPKDFGIAPDCFVVLCMGNTDSSLDRKNPYDAIAAFKTAFGHARDKLLILQIGRLSSWPRSAERLHAAVGDAPNILIWRETLSNEERFALIQRADVVLSLHRAEGFGLLLAEAMYLGKPVIATAWSGNMDFMNRQNAVLISARKIPVRDDTNFYNCYHQKWANPDIKSAAYWLQKLYDNPQLRQRTGASAKSFIQSLLTLEYYRKQTGVA